MKGGRAVALEDLDLYADTATAPFWLVVDSQNSYQARGSTEWAETRGHDCLALRSDGSRCAQMPADGDPFCAFHFERAAGWFLARATATQIKRARFEVDRMYGDATQTLADAAAILATTPVGHRVYFYELIGQGLVKIGTSRRPENRIKEFAKGRGCTFPEGCDPSTGHLIGHIAGDVAVERALHWKFGNARVKGEWFRLTDDLADHIEALLIADGARAAA